MNNKATTLGSAPTLHNKKLFLFDIDGTIAVGNDLYDGSRDLIEYIDSIGGKTYYITNNSTTKRNSQVRTCNIVFCQKF